MGIVDKIKSDAKKTGGNKAKFIFASSGAKLRVRFLQDMDDGKEFIFHDSFTKGVNVPCRENFGDDCPLCGDDELRTRSMYAWSVFDYEANEVRVFMFAVNQCSPLQALAAMYETFGTLMDRDYVIKVSGQQKDKVCSVIPMDKAKFRNEKAKPFSESALKKMVNKAYPFDSDENEDEDGDDTAETKKAKKSKSQKEETDEKPNNKKVKPAESKKKKNSKEEDEEDDDYEIPFDGKEDEAEGDNDDDTADYEEMDLKELYLLCKKRGINVPTEKKSKRFYIAQLEEADEADEWDDEDDDE